MNGRLNAKALKAQVDRFNERYGVGQAVSVRRDSGEALITVTRSKAEVLSGHTPVIWVEGISGCYPLDRVSPIAGSSA